VNPRHWFDARLQEAGARADHLVRTRASGEPGLQVAARRAFMECVRALATDVVARAGVRACVVSHDGLVLARAGSTGDDEAIAATGQVCLASTGPAGAALLLGAVRQVVIIGDDHKLALFVVGPVAVGVLAPSSMNLAEALG
jgi:predicted regulator of Ras-like GTPase activity (Roadblock/LC7/MglB family)